MTVRWTARDKEGDLVQALFLCDTLLEVGVRLLKALTHADVEEWEELEVKIRRLDLRSLPVVCFSRGGGRSGKAGQP